MHIVISMPDDPTRASFIPVEEMAAIQRMGTVWTNDSQQRLTPDIWAKVLPEAHAVITGWGAPCFDESLMQYAPNLKIIAHTGGSVATMAHRAIYDAGVHLVSANEVYAQSVAEGVIGYIMAAQRSIPYWSNVMREGGWGRQGDHPTRALLEKNVGLIGFGAVCRYLTPMLAAFSCRVSAYDPFVDEARMAAFGVRKVSLEEAMNNDIVSLHAPKTPETNGLIGAAQLALMPDGALLVNTARGNQLDEKALSAEVASGRLRCMLDVYEPEPPAEDHPLRTQDGSLLIPHMAGPTIDRRPAATRFVLAEIARVFAGETPLHAIPYEYAMRMTQ